MGGAYVRDERCVTLAFGKKKKEKKKMSIQWQSQFLLSSTRNDRKCTFYYLQYQLDVIRVYAAVTLIEYFVTAIETRSWCAIILLHCI